MQTLQEAPAQESSELRVTQSPSESLSRGRFDRDESQRLNPSTMVCIDDDDSADDTSAASFGFNTMVLVDSPDSPTLTSSSTSVSESFSTMVVKQPASMIARVLTDSATSSDDERFSGEEYATTVHQGPKKPTGPSPWDSLKVPVSEAKASCSSDAASSVAVSAAPVKRLIPKQHLSVNTAVMQSLKRLSFLRQSGDYQASSTPVEVLEPADALPPQPV